MSHLPVGPPPPLLPLARGQVLPVVPPPALAHSCPPATWPVVLLRGRSKRPISPPNQPPPPPPPPPLLLLLLLLLLLFPPGDARPWPMVARDEAMEGDTSML